MARSTAEYIHLGTGLDATPHATRRLLALLLRRLLQFYWATCVAIIVMGLNQMFPQVGEKIHYAFEDPALELEHPFPNCAVAHRAGYFNIPRASRAYVLRQDEDLNGKACEPYPGYPQDYLSRLRVIEHRLEMPYVRRD
jgi:hypothetical protein